MQKSFNMVPLHVVPEEDYAHEISNAHREQTSNRGEDITPVPEQEKSEGGTNQGSKSPGGFISGIFSKTKKKLVQSHDRKCESGSKSPIITDQKRSSFASFGQMGINLFKKIGDATGQRKNTM